MENMDQMADAYFTELLNTDLNALLAPIVSHPLVGESLNGTEIWSAIRNAREEEDASLPQGSWERELKRAEWPTVSRLCIQALTTQSKDLQIAVWLMEAEIHRHGFRALAPCLTFLAMLSETFWQPMYPLDVEHRSNLFRWVADKMRLPLRRLPFTATGSGVNFGWADWEQAQRNEQIRAALGKAADESIEGTTLPMFSSALACTPADDLFAVHDHLAAAMAALSMLEEVIDELLGDDAPLFDPLRDLLENISLMLEAEVRKRGISRKQSAQDEALAALPDGAAPVDSASDGPISTADRRRLYSALSLMADQLARLEPHSPVPYLIRRAVEWGGLNTAQLYNEVFVRCGGQINIFELLGLEEQIAAQEEASN